jgi:hypothetical protein
LKGRLQNRSAVKGYISEPMAMTRDQSHIKILRPTSLTGLRHIQNPVMVRNGVRNVYASP